MADKLMQPTWDPLVLAAQLQKIARQSQTLMQRFVSNQPDAIKLGIGDTSGLGFDFFELMAKMMINPAAVASAQIDLFNDTLSVWQKTAERMLMLRAHEADAPKDKRFKHPEWSENAIFSFVKDSYLVAAKSILSAVREVKGMDDATARKVDFYTRQFVDALSPSNFVATNPEVLTATLETGGQNLLRGLENLLVDLERGNGRLSITREDHIAPWKSTYAATHLYSGPVKFVLSASGHMAGVISAPGSKCGHWANDNLPPSPDEWFAGATPHLGSWWPVWDEWITQLDSGRVPAREPGGGKLTIIEDAPGSYVRVRSAA